MKVEIVAEVVQVSNYEVDGSRGGKITVLEQTTEERPNRVGAELSTIRCPFEFVEQMRKERFPQQLSLLCNVVQGAGNKAQLIAESWKKTAKAA